MTRMLLCGRRANISSDDLTVPASISLLWRSAWWTIAIALLASQPSVYTDLCFTPALIFIAASLLVAVGGVGLDLYIAIKSAAGTLVDDRPRRHVPSAATTRLALAGVETALFIYGVIAAALVPDECTPRVASDSLVHAVLGCAAAGLALSLLAAMIGGCLSWCGMRHEQLHSLPPEQLFKSSARRWSRRCRRCAVCCRGGAGIEDTFELVGTVMAGVFESIDVVGFAATDLAAGLALVHAVHKAEEAEALHELRVREREDAAAAASTGAHAPPRVHIPPVHTRDGSTGSSPAVSPWIAGLHSALADFPRAVVRAHRAVALRTKQHAPFIGTSHALSASSADDVRVLIDSAHFSAYALGAYGWMMYAYMNMGTWCCKLPAKWCGYACADAQQAMCAPSEVAAVSSQNPLHRLHYRAMHGTGRGEGLVEGDPCGCNEAALRRILELALDRYPSEQPGAARLLDVASSRALPAEVLAAGVTAVRRAPPAAPWDSCLHPPVAAVESPLQSDAAGAARSADQPQRAFATHANVGADKGVTHRTGGTAGRSAEGIATDSNPTSAFSADDILYASHSNAFFTCPWYVAVDRKRRALVVAVRGTLSLEDCVTDALALPTSIAEEVSGVAEILQQMGLRISADRAYVHGGMWRAATAIRAQLIAHNLLESAVEQRPASTNGVSLTVGGRHVDVAALRAGTGMGSASMGDERLPSPPASGTLSHDRERPLLDTEEPAGTWTGVATSQPADPRSGPSALDSAPARRRCLAAERTQPLQLIVVGHSLGAGVASLLSLQLLPDFPTLKCFAYAPPGALVSTEIARAMEQWVTTIVIGKDMVPRMSLPSLTGLLNEVLDTTARCRVSKLTLLRAAAWHCAQGCIPEAVVGCAACSRCTRPEQVEVDRPVADHDVQGRPLLPHLLLPPGTQLPDTAFTQALHALRAAHTQFQREAMSFDESETEAPVAHLEAKEEIEAIPAAETKDEAAAPMADTSVRGIMIAVSAASQLAAHARERAATAAHEAEREVAPASPQGARGTLAETTPTEHAEGPDTASSTGSEIVAREIAHATAQALPGTAGRRSPAHSIASLPDPRVAFRRRMYVPGRILHFIKVGTAPIDFPSAFFAWWCPNSWWIVACIASLLCCCCRRVRNVYEPRWTTRTALTRMLVSASMIADHMPDKAVRTLQDAVDDAIHGALPTLADLTAAQVDTAAV